MPRASFGSVFRRRYRDRHGALRTTANWSIEYRVPGRRKVRRESTPFTKKSDAQKLLRQRMGEADAGRVALKPDTSFDDLKHLIVNDYKVNERDSLFHLEHVRLPKLEAFFGGWRANEIKTRHVERYKLWRLGLPADDALLNGQVPIKLIREAPADRPGAAPATVNRELATLKRMFNLAVDQELIPSRPKIALLKEHNVRTGFFEWNEFAAFLSHLAPEYQALFQLAFITGWRIRSELLTRRWSHVEFGGRGCLRLEPGEGKDPTGGREFPFTDWMRQVMVDQRQAVSQVERKTDRIIPWVFCKRNGQPIRDFRWAWQKARKASGLDRIPHDFRRTAVRNLEKAGVPRAAAMKMVGHKTESIDKRYSIVDHAMLEIGADKLNAAHQAALTPARRPASGGRGDKRESPREWIH